MRPDIWPSFTAGERGGSPLPLGPASLALAAPPEWLAAPISVKLSAGVLPGFNDLSWVGPAAGLSSRMKPYRSVAMRGVPDLRASRFNT